MGSAFIGIEIGGTKLQLVRGNAAGELTRDPWRAQVDPEQGGAGIRRQIEQGIAELTRTESAKAIGVGFGGPIDWRTGQICRSHQIDGWENFQIGAWLRELTSLPVAVDNDANVAALGEAVRGAGRGLDPVFYVTLGSGVGGGLVAGGAIYHGDAPGEAEFGHVRLDRDGTTVESRCSGWSIDSRIREQIKREPGSVLANLTAGQTRGEARHLPAALESGDALATGILQELAADLGFALSHVVHLAHPQVVVLGGGLSLIGEPLRQAVQVNLRRHLMEAFGDGPTVSLAELGERAVPTGALLLAASVRDA